MINPISYNYQTNFKANLHSPKLKLYNNDFFIKMPQYGKNESWADEIVKTADSAVDLIRGNMDGEAVLRSITGGVHLANLIPMDIMKRISTGYMRIERDGWQGAESGKEILTSYNNERYGGYKERFEAIVKTPLKRLNNEIGMSIPNNKGDIEHGPSANINNSLDYIFKLYKNKYSKFLKKDIKKEDLPEIIDVVAEIRWVLAHATPWLRGSDAISNVFMRAMLKAVGVKAYPPADSISYDLEAYCRDLDDYKANFNSFFEKPLEVIE